MRIRKRWPPPPPPPSSPPSLTTSTPDLRPSRLQPLSSLAASSELQGLGRIADLAVGDTKRFLPPADSLNNSSLRQPKNEDRQRSDLQLTMVRDANGWICSSASRDDESDENTKKKKGDCMHRSPSLDSQAGALGGGGEDAEEKRLAASHSRNENSNGARTSVGISLSSSSYHQVGRWCEGDRAFPLKKRRGSFERKVSSDEDTIMEKEKKMKTKMKTKATKKWLHDNDDDDDNEEEEEEEEEEDKPNRIVVKNRGSSGMVMEGSRCSRVNGRGWRCRQQTLVGYSLCEHHLGKGRLRSMSSVRNRASTITRPKKETERRLLSSSSTQQLKSFEEEDDEEDEIEEEEEDKPLMITKKGKKIGMVKARSISSLLGQTYNAPVATLQPSTTDTINSNVVT